MMVSGVHNVCKMGYYVAIISAMVETAEPEKELAPALDLVGAVKEKFITISDMLVPSSDFKDNIFITNTMDPTSHFETATDNVLELYKKITGKDLDLTNLPEDDQE
jgi:Rab GDP dissociation inhibitor